MKIIKEISTKIRGIPVEEALMPYYLSSVTPNRKSCTLYLQQEGASTLLPQQEEGRFSSCPATSLANGKCHISANERPSPC